MKSKLRQKKLPANAGPMGAGAKFSRPAPTGRSMGASEVSGKVSTHGQWDHSIMNCAHGSAGDHGVSVGSRRDPDRDGD